MARFRESLGGTIGAWTVTAAGLRGCREAEAAALARQFGRSWAMTDQDYRQLHAEVIALQAVLMAVFRRMARDSPELTPLFCRAFDDAEAILTGVATREGLEDALGTTTSALAIIEELRRAVIRDPDACGPAADKR